MATATETWYNMEMASRLHRTHRLLARATMVLAAMTAAFVVLPSILGGGLQGKILTQARTPVPWVFLDETQIAGGTTLPADSHVVFHLPEAFDRITLDVLFGQRSKDVRFWGYCLPANYDIETQETRSNLPGQLFLSRREREVREAAMQKPQPSVSLFKLPSISELREGNTAKGQIRHEMDVFLPNMLCYVMTETPLPIGIDPDDDTLNTSLERDIGTIPNNPDSDADGVQDGVEFRTATDPSQRDTDVDGLLDGIEDANWNGRIDKGETDPRTKDSDRDGLCDGLCMLKVNQVRMYAGEDKNLNGKIDDKETSPLLWDSDGDGSNDFVRFLNCEINRTETC